MKNKKSRKIISTFLTTIMLLSLTYLGYKTYQKYLLTHFNGRISSEDFHPYNIPNTPSVDDVIRTRTSIKGFYGLVASEHEEINVPVWRGLSDYALYRGGALWNTEMEFGKGHIVLFGHNVVDKYLFGHLSSLKVGSKVYMYQGKDMYVYEVYESRAGWDSESKYVETGINGTPTATLVTCIGMYPTNARYFVKVKLVSKLENNKNIDEIKDKFAWS